MKAERAMKASPPGLLFCLKATREHTSGHNRQTLGGSEVHFVPAVQEGKTPQQAVVSDFVLHLKQGKVKSPGDGRGDDQLRLMTPAQA